MSPEQIRSDLTDHRSDIFSAGATFYEILTYRKPFYSTSLPATLFKILQENPEPPQSIDPGVPPELSAIILHALEKDPAQRYQTTDHMMENLEEFRRQLDQHKKQLRQETEDAIDCLNRFIADHPEILGQDAQGDTIADRTTMNSAAPATEGADEATLAGFVIESSAGYDEIRAARDLAKREFHRLTSLHEAHKRAASVVEQALALEQKGNLEEALRTAERVSPEMLRFSNAAALISRLKEELERRRQEQEKQSRIALLLEQARQMCKAGNLEESVAGLESVLALDPTHAEATALHAEITNRILELRQLQQRAQEAEEFIRKAEPLFSAGEFSGATQLLEKALELVPEHEAARRLVVLIQQRRAEEAAREEKRRQAEAALHAARNALRTGNVSRARQEVERALETDPEASGARELLQEVERTEREKRAEEERKRRIAELLAQSRILLQAGAEEEALERLGELLEVDPRNNAALELQRSIVQKREDEARRERERQKRIESKIQLTQKALRSGDLEEALKTAKQVLSEDPDHAQALQLLKDSEEALQRRVREDLERRERTLLSAAAESAGRKEFARAVESLEQASPDLAGLASIGRALEDYREKARQQEEARRRAEEEKRAKIRSLLKEARSAQSSGDLPRAIELTTSALQVDPAAVEARHLLNALQQEQERIQREREEREQLIRKLVSRAKELADRENFDEAAAVLAGARPDIASSPQIQQPLALYQQTLREREEARLRAERERITGELLSRAKELADRENFDEAVALLARARPDIASTAEIQQPLALYQQTAQERREARLKAEKEKEERIASLLDQAREAWDFNDPQGALELARALLAEDPGHVEAARIASLSEGELQARELEQKAQIVVSQAEDLAKGERYEEAVSLLDKVDSTLAERRPVREALMRYREIIRQRDEARARALRIQQYLKGGGRAFEEGDYARCESEMAALLTLDPDHSEAKQLMAQARARIQQQREEELRRNRISEALRAARRFFESGKLEPALAGLGQALALDPENQDAARLRLEIEARQAEIQEQQRKRAEAQRLFAEATRLLGKADAEGADQRLREACALWPDLPGIAKLGRRIEKARKRLKPVAASHKTHSFPRSRVAAAAVIIVVLGAAGFLIHRRLAPPIAGTHASAASAFESTGPQGVATAGSAESQVPHVTPSEPTPSSAPAALPPTVGPAAPTVRETGPREKDLSAQVQNGNRRARELADSGRYDEAMKEISGVLRLAPKDPEARRMLAQLDRYARQGAEEALGQMQDAKSKATQAQAGTLALGTFGQAQTAEAEAMKLFQVRDYGGATVRLFEAADAFRRAEGEAHSRAAAAEEERLKAAQRDGADAARQAFAASRAQAAKGGADKLSPENYRQALDLATKAEAQMDKGDYAGARSGFEAASKALQLSLNAASAQRQGWEGLKTSKDLSALQAFLKEHPASPFTGQVEQRIEEVEWEGINKKDSAALRGFLQRHPKGIFAQQALTDIAGLEKEQRFDADLQAIQQVLTAYAGAFRRMDPKAVRSAWPGIPKETLDTIQQTFRNARTLELRLIPLRAPSVTDGSAEVTCQREIRQTFRDGDTPPPVRDTVTVKLTRTGDGWVIDSIR
jgi:tetratricopeptide (TPR) repeat protein